jgi:hypothetical protein
MSELLRNIYGGTLKQIIEDLKIQYDDYVQWEKESGESTLVERKKFIRLMKEPIELYNKYNHGNIELPKLES